jgi:hypothetical protein
MTIEQLLAALTAAGATRVRIELDFAVPLHADPSASTLLPDQAPRAPEAANQPAESPDAHSESEEDDEQQARDLELAHLDP